MVTTDASATWKGNLPRGEGRIRSRTLDDPYTFAARFEDEEGLNPEELIGSALAGCFAMALAHGLSEAGHEPESVDARTRVHFDPEALAVTKIELEAEGRVPGLDADGFRAAAGEAKENCPISKALAGVEIVLTEARLAGGA